MTNNLQGGWEARVIRVLDKAHLLLWTCEGLKARVTLPAQPNLSEDGDTSLTLIPDGFCGIALHKPLPNQVREAPGEHASRNPGVVNDRDRSPFRDVAFHFRGTLPPSQA